MYPLLALGALLRIVVALLLLFVVVPWIARGSRPSLARFFSDLGLGIAILTLAGQVLTLLRLYALPTVVLLGAVVILVARSRAAAIPPLDLLRATYHFCVAGAIEVMERRISIRRRVRRWWRRVRREVRVKAAGAGWIALTLVAAAYRLYRPFATANLGYSDSYGHLYLVKLLDAGRQVDPAWGPYPRGMHFLLIAIQRLTNVDEILLVNVFGSVAGVLLVLGVAWTARELSGSEPAGLLAGFIFATMVGGPGQYFIVGGSFESDDAGWVKEMTLAPYGAVPPGGGEFDVLLTAFQRQTSTLSQELAIMLLFPTAALLFRWLQGCPSARWGFAGGTAAIAAIHSGVLVPLSVLCAVVSVVSMVRGEAGPRVVGEAALTAFAAITVGSSWLLGFVAYPLVAAGTQPGSTALYYFPFLSRFMGGAGTTRILAYNTITPFLLILVAAAMVLILLGRRARMPGASVAAFAFLVFLLVHASSRLGLPQIVESRRNSEWLLMAVAILIGVAAAACARLLPRLAASALPAILAAAWLTRIPGPSLLRERMLDYSGYGSASLAVVEIVERFQPFTWTVVSYGQEFPMVLGRGFFVNGFEFLSRYDPLAPDLEIPTPHVFIVTERIPHRFEVRDWKPRFSRAEVERRLLTWSQLYRATHDDMRLFLDDGNVQVYQISRSEETAGRIATRGRAR